MVSDDTDSMVKVSGQCPSLNIEVDGDLSVNGDVVAVLAGSESEGGPNWTRRRCYCCRSLRDGEARRGGEGWVVNKWQWRGY